MAKFHNLGFVGVPKGDAKKRYLKIEKGVTLTIKTKDGSELTLPEGSYINMFEPRQRKGESEEQFGERKKWQRFDVTVIVDE
jgi:hypothetical protein